MTMRGSWWLFLFVLLSGCMGPVARPWPSEQPSGTNRPSGTIDFGWKLSGDRAIAPLQVFSDASRTWLQWLPNQVLPIILGASEQGEQVLTYLRQGPYTIIEGHWPALMFRSARQQARARRAGASFASSDTRLHSMSKQQSGSQQQPALQQQSGSQQQSAMQQQSGWQQQSASQPQSGSQQQSGQHAASANRTHGTEGRPGAPASLLSSHTLSPDGATQASRPFFSVSQTDRHLRQALTRWAGLSGWRFEPEHWAVDIDVPLSASAKFSDDFVSSVQALLAATELSDRPLQPCFYSNQVLRIVPVAEPCDRTLGDGAST